jgi:hypothetical protein
VGEVAYNNKNDCSSLNYTNPGGWLEGPGCYNGNHPRGITNKRAMPRPSLRHRAKRPFVRNRTTLSLLVEAVLGFPARSVTAPAGMDAVMVPDAVMPLTAMS